jgi:hypothetical protein
VVKFLLGGILLFSFSLAYSEERVGRAYYAIQSKRWPCGESLKAFNGVGVPRLSFLWNTFGTDTSCVERFLRRRGPKVLEIHLINEVCQRNNRCGPYEFLSRIGTATYRRQLDRGDSKLYTRIRRLSEKVRKVILPFEGKGLHCIISPGLESNLPNKTARKLIDFVRPLFPKCDIAWNPLNGGPIEGTFHEMHGRAPAISPPCIANLDGEDMDIVDVGLFLKMYRGCHSIFLWTDSYNLNTSGRFIDPRGRKIVPSAFDLKRTE